MQLQVEEANAQVIKEREAAQKAIEEAPPVVKETPVFVEDTEKINSLMAEVESLKVGFNHLANLYILLELQVYIMYVGRNNKAKILENNLHENVSTK